jgi:hypothetical protein
MMEGTHMRQSIDLSKADKQSYVVYDKTTGGIVHIHCSIVVPGAKHPTEKDTHDQSMKLAIHRLGRKGDFATLSVDESKLKRDHRYSVDPETKKLEGVLAQSRLVTRSQPGGGRLSYDAPMRRRLMMVGGGSLSENTALR